MAQIINIGLVGCGYWGPNLARNFASLSDCRLQAFCDSDAGRLAHMQSHHPGARAYSDFNQFILDPSIDAVIVATNVRHHFAMGRASLLSGKHTLIEKPMATSLVQCEILDGLARDRGLTLMAGHTFLFSPVVRRIKQLLDNGEIGDVRYICARRLNLGLFQRDINVAWDLAPHDLSIIIYMLDSQPISVNCQGSSHVNPGVQDVASMWLSFSNGRSAMIQSSWLDPRKTREMTIVGTKKMIVYDDVSEREKIRIYDTRVAAPPHYDTFAEFQYAYHYGDVTIPYVKQEEPLKVECQHFIDCIRSGANPISGAEHAAKVVRILEASTRSLGQNGVPIDLIASVVPHLGATANAAQTGRIDGFHQTEIRRTKAGQLTQAA